MFGEKLDFLMKITNTQNSVLGRAVLLDAAHISRLRRGQRALPKKPAFLSQMAGYFARHLPENYQRRVVRDELRLTAWPTDEAEAALLIEKWLLDEGDPAPDILPLLQGLAIAPRPGISVGERQPLPKAKQYYYGPEGKREAVLQFFKLILKEKTPQTLLLSSDEEFSWLYEDPVFARRWAADFSKVLQQGNRVRIIHATGRDWNEMLQGLSQWVPIYTTGMIEPYYYPKLRDGVCQRTLFIAPNTAAIVSSSVLKETNGMLNELVTEGDAVAALTLEYHRYLSLCRPLMRILTTRQADELWKAWDTLTRGDADIICMSALPTLATMPEWVAAAMQARAPQSRIAELYAKGAAALQALTERCQYSEVLPDWGAVPALPPLPCAELMGAPGVCYTAAELLAHCENADRLAQSHKNYRIVRAKDIPGNLLLYCQQERGVIMAKTDTPGVAFTLTEPNLTSAFWDYLAGK